MLSGRNKVSSYTPQFEIALSDHRPAVVSLFDELPFYVRTRAGVALAHAGASHAASTVEGLRRLADYSHSAEMAKVDALLEGQDRASVRAGLAKLSGQDYAVLVEQNMGLTDSDDPRYDDVLRGVLVTGLSSDFQRLWEATFNKNEHQYGLEEYARLLGYPGGIVGRLRRTTRDRQWAHSGDGGLQGRPRSAAALGELGPRHSPRSRPLSVVRCRALPGRRGGLDQGLAQRVYAPARGPPLGFGHNL